MIQILSFKNSKKIYELYFAIKQPKKDIKSGFLSVFIDSVHFLNNSLDNLAIYLD